MKMSKMGWFTMGWFLGIAFGLMVMAWAYDHALGEETCVTGAYVLPDENVGGALVIGGQTLCGRDLHFGNIEGPYNGKPPQGRELKWR